MTTTNVLRHHNKLKLLYSRHPLLELFVESSFPFLFFLTYVSFSRDTEHKYVLSVLCILANFFINQIPMSLHVPTNSTVVSSSTPIFTAFVFSLNAVMRYLLLVAGFALLLDVKSSELYRGVFEGCTLLVTSIYVFTLCATSSSLPLQT